MEASGDCVPAAVTPKFATSMKHREYGFQRALASGWMDVGRNAAAIV